MGSFFALMENAAVFRQKAITCFLEECGQERYKSQNGTFNGENAVVFEITNICLVYYFNLLLCLPCSYE